MTGRGARQTEDGRSVQIFELTDKSNVDVLTGTFNAWAAGSGEDASTSGSLHEVLAWARARASKVVLQAGLYEYSVGRRSVDGIIEATVDDWPFPRRLWYQLPSGEVSDWWVMYVCESADRAGIVAARLQEIGEVKGVIAHRDHPEPHVLALFAHTEPLRPVTDQALHIAERLTGGGDLEIRLAGPG